MSGATRIIPPLMVMAMMLLPSSAGAQELYIYPSKGQSSSQQSKDQAQCRQWAVKQTGIEPEQTDAGPGPSTPASAA